MAQRQKSSRSSVQDADSMESLKPLIVLGLLGTIMYGAYSVVQKGPTPPSSAAATSAADDPHNVPPLASPPLVVPPPMAAPAPPAPALQAATAAAPVAAPTSFEPRPVQQPMSMAPAATVPPPPEAFPPAEQPAAQPTYLSAQSAAPPLPSPPQSDFAAQVPSALSAPPTPGRAATLASAGAMEVSPHPVSPLGTAGQPQAASPSPAFTAAWADAHEKLAAGRYAEALAVLSVWYDDPSLGPEESQRQEDLLGRLAGTVIYSQQDHLLPPCIVAPGEDLQSIAAPLSVPWQLLAKINGVPDPSQLVPGEHLKVVRGPFDAVISVSRRRLSLQVGGNYAGSFPVVIGRQIHDRIGASIPVLDVRRGVLTHDQPSVASQVAYNGATGKKLILLGEGMSLEAVEDISLVAESAPGSSLVVSSRDLDELLDILGPGSQVLVRR